MNKMMWFGAGLMALGSVAIVMFFRGSDLIEGDDDMGKKVAPEQKHLEAEKEIFKPRAKEPKPETLVSNYNKDNRTDTGVKVTPATDKFQDHHSLDEGVDTNAPHVDPGHIRNSILGK